MVACATEATARPGAECFDRPVRGGYALKKLTQHFVLGYFRRIPAPKAFGVCGTDSLTTNEPCAILIANSYFDAHGQLRNR
jgi:hypothetical protein